MERFERIRAPLDVLYRWAGYLAAVFLVMILALVSLQMLARWSGQIFAGAPDFTGYCMAAASFFAMPYALNKGNHIRVSLLLGALGRHRFWAELWCWAVASALTVLFAWYAVKLTRESHLFNDISQGQDAWPIWIPQVSMAAGTILLAVCAIDNLVTLLVRGRDNIRPSTTGAGAMEE